MVNSCKSLINVVIANKPKMLTACLTTDTGLDQKVGWPSSGAPNSPDADDAPPAERRDLTHSGTHSERGKPVVLPHWDQLSREGKRAARQAQGAAGMGGRSKRMPLCNRADRG